MALAAFAITMTTTFYNLKKYSEFKKYTLQICTSGYESVYVLGMKSCRCLISGNTRL